MKLYLFTNELSLRVLRDGKLPLLAVDALNDPFLDSSIPLHEVQQIPISATEFSNELRRQYEALPEDLRSIVSFEYFVQEASQRRSDIETAMQGRRQTTPQYLDKALRSKLAIGCFFQHIQNPGIWEQQGAQHGGMALEIDVELAQFKATTYDQHPQHFAEINYVDERPLTSDAPHESQMLQRFRPLFQRPTVFQQQGEWRLVRPLAAAQKQGTNSVGQTLGFYKFPSSTVTGVVFGCYTSTQEIEHIAAAVTLDLRYRHVKLWQLQKDPVRYLFHKVPIALERS